MTTSGSTASTDEQANDERGTAVEENKATEDALMAKRAMARRTAVIVLRAAARARVELPVTEDEALAVFQYAPERTTMAVARDLRAGSHPAALTLIAAAMTADFTAFTSEEDQRAATALIDNALVFGEVLDAAAQRSSNVPLTEVLDRALALHEGSAPGAPHKDYLLHADEAEVAQARAYVIASLLDWRKHGLDPQRPDDRLVEAVLPYADRPEWVFQQSLERGAYDPNDLIESLSFCTTGGAEGFL